MQQLAYFEERARQEALAASLSSGAEAAIAHRQLAAAYEAAARELRLSCDDRPAFFKD